MVTLSKLTEKDIEDIFDFTATEFSPEQAVRYIEGFDSTFDHLSKNPKIGRKRDEIRKGLRSLMYGSHIIFYRVINRKIFVVRILHGSCDLPNYL